ncbi:hypothetical protein [Rhodococcus koreensis]
MADDDISAGRGPYEAATANLHTSLKWLIASSGAVAALVVAGLQLGDLAGTGFGLRTIVAVLAAAIALGIVLFVLVRAVKMLTLPRLTAADIADREEAVIPPGQPPIGVLSDSLIQWIHDRRTYLLGASATVSELYEGRFVGPMNALDDLSRGQAAQWNGRQILTTDDVGVEALHAAFAQANRQLARIEDAVHYERTREEFRQLFSHYPWGAAVFGAAVVAFALASQVSEDPKPQQIATPTRVEVLVPENRKADLPERCRDDTLGGVAIGGTLRTPTVVISAPDDCAGTIITADAGIVAIPVFGAPAPPASG